MYSGERLNSITHVIGAAFALVGLGALLAVAAVAHDPKMFLSFGAFGVSMVLLYTMSALYHSFELPRVKRVFRVFDHVSIYLLIAGTYTPFMLVGLGGESGTRILLAVWAMAIVGSIGEVFLRGPIAKAAQLLAYLGMGWACALDFEGLRAVLPPEAMLWLLAGGAAYTVGVVFYVLGKLDRLRPAHGIWHLLVMAGTVCHFIAVVGYLR